MFSLIEETPSEKFEKTLARFFPVKLGHVKAIDASLRRIMIEEGSLPVYHADDFAEVPYKVWEWEKGRWNRIK